MAITRVNFVQGVTWAAVGGTTYASPSQNITAGNTLVVCVGGNAVSAQSVTGITDTAGNTYTKVAHAFNTGDQYRDKGSDHNTGESLSCIGIIHIRASGFDPCISE